MVSSLSASHAQLALFNNYNSNQNNDNKVGSKNASKGLGIDLECSVKRVQHIYISLPVLLQYCMKSDLHCCPCSTGNITEKGYLHYCWGTFSGSY